MIETLTLENFRGFKKIVIPELSQITLISGKNNAGKSSLLEGIFAIFGYAAPDSFAKISNFRGMMPVLDASNIWEPMFYNLDSKMPIRISMVLDGENIILKYRRDDTFAPIDLSGMPQEVAKQFVATAKTSYSLYYKLSKGNAVDEGHFIASLNGVARNSNNDVMMDPLPLAQYISSATFRNDGAILEWFGKLELDGKKQQIIDTLKMISPAISDVSTIVKNGQTQIYVKSEGKLLPLKLAGDGLHRLLYIVLAIMENPNAIILIDEIETGFHYSMYEKIWETLALAVKESGSQIIATTHSYECIDNAIDGIKKAEMAQHFCYYRIEQGLEEHRVFQYKDDLLESAVGFNMEVR